MNKTLVALLSLILVGLGLYFVLTKYEPAVTGENTNEESRMGSGQTPVSADEQEVRGTVTAVDTEKAMVDGPVLITIEKEEGGTALIAIPSMGLPTCAARENIADAFAIKAGELVEARGEVGEQGMIIPCSSSAHYLRVVAAN